MLLVTWNLGSLEARLPRLLDLLERRRPDVVLLQETMAAAGTALPHALAAAGYTAVGHGAGRWTGVALLAGPGRALLDVRAGLPGEPRPEEARWLEATVAGIRVVSVDVPDSRAVGSPGFGEKLAFLDAAAARLAGLANRPLVVAGDFNVAPGDLDVEDVEDAEDAEDAEDPPALETATRVTRAERERLRRLLGTGLVDAWRDLHPEERGYTWWDRPAAGLHRGSAMRVDLALVARQLGPRLLDCRVDCRYRTGPSPSDHAPLLLTLRE
jgi:exodeoxyribonuclease-3